MPGLPDRPDLAQLRRQARELLRAAVSGEPAAVARIGVVSARMTLSAAQQALALEYGYRNWAALRAEVARRRSPLERWSFGGAIAIETGAGTLLPEGLAVGDGDALLFTSLIPWDASPGDDAWSNAGSWSVHGGSWSGRPGTIDDEIRALEPSAGTDDITVADDQGATYALSLRSASGAHGPSPQSIWLRVDPIPGPSVRWIELRGRNETAARLLRSPRAVVRLGRLTPVIARPAERAVTDDAASATPDATDPAGPRHHLDLGVTVPALDGITLQLDSLFSTRSGWSLRLRATPRWFRYRDDGKRKWSPVAISAEDDRGHSYSYRFGGSSGRDGHEYVTLQFTQRLDPLTRRLRLTCTGSTNQVTLDVDLPAPPG